MRPDMGGYDKGIRFLAEYIIIDTENFTGNLSNLDSDLQTALETLDQMSPTVVRYTSPTLVDPHNLYDISPRIPLFRSPGAAIDKIYVTLDADGQQIAGDLKYADAMIGLANATVIKAIDTTSGVFTDTNVDTAVAEGKWIYIEFDAQPHADIKYMNVTVHWR